MLAPCFIPVQRPDLSRQTAVSVWCAQSGRAGLLRALCGCHPHILTANADQMESPSQGRFVEYCNADQWIVNRVTSESLLMAPALISTQRPSIVMGGMV